MENDANTEFIEYNLRKLYKIEGYIEKNDKKILPKEKKPLLKYNLNFAIKLIQEVPVLENKNNANNLGAIENISFFDEQLIRVYNSELDLLQEFNQNIKDLDATGLEDSLNMMKTCGNYEINGAYDLQNMISTIKLYHRLLDIAKENSPITFFPEKITMYSFSRLLWMNIMHDIKYVNQKDIPEDILAKEIIRHAKLEIVTAR